MGARPSQFKKGGGFLDGVDGVITDYTFTDEFNGAPFVAGKIRGSDGKQIDKPHSLNCLLGVTVDGATEVTNTTLKVAGDFDVYEVDETGHILTMADGGPCEISNRSAMAKFIQSLCNPTGGGTGFDENNFSEDPDSIDFTPMLGTRVRLVQLTDAARTKEFGKKKGKNGKEYDRKDLVVEKVYGDEAPATTGKTVATKAKPGPKGKTTTPAVQKVDVPQLSGEAVQEMLTRAGKPLDKSKLSMLTLTTPLLKKHPQREDVRKYLGDDDNLDELAAANFFQFDRVKQVLSAAAE